MISLSLNDHKDILSLILCNYIKDPMRSQVCKLWNHINQKFMFPLILNSYRQQEYVRRFSKDLPQLVIGAKNIHEVKKNISIS